MYEFRITKYDPNKRNKLGHYLDANEWTCFSDVGKSVSLEEYEAIEKAYILSVIDLFLNAGISYLKIKGFENYHKHSDLKENEVILMADLSSELQSVLRNEFWCMFESEKGFVHFGYDYYMYVGVSEINNLLIDKIRNRRLFVEEFVSPYHEENC